MTPGSILSLAISVATLIFVIILMVRLRQRKRGGPGPGAAGAVYDLLHEDKRQAIEIIAEGQAEATDPEHADDKPSAGLRNEERGTRNEE